MARQPFGARHVERTSAARGEADVWNPKTASAMSAARFRSRRTTDSSAISALLDRMLANHAERLDPCCFDDGPAGEIAEQAHAGSRRSPVRPSRTGRESPGLGAERDCQQGRRVDYLPRRDAVAVTNLNLAAVMGRRNGKKCVLGVRQRCLRTRPRPPLSRISSLAGSRRLESSCSSSMERRRYDHARSPRFRRRQRGTATRRNHKLPAVGHLPELPPASARATSCAPTGSSRLT